MALNTTMPNDIPKSSDTLAGLPADLLDAPPAYYSFGSTPQPMNDPPNVGDKGTAIVRWECTGEGKTVRTDGELRYTRKLTILWAVPEGSPKPPDATSDQPALFGDDGEATDDPEALGDVLDNVSRPSFSNGASE